MPKDYKHRRRQATQSGSRPTPPRRWPWFTAGLLLGLGLSVLTIGYERGYLAFAFPQSGDAIAATHVPSQGHVDTSKPTFEFYTMLPEMEVAVSDEEVLERPSTEVSTDKDKVLAGSYVLQVGSFRQLTDADRLKANLALLGLEAQIQTVSINGEETWHRVRVGPYDKSTRLNEARNRLKDNKINSILLKIKS